MSDLWHHTVIKSAEHRKKNNIALTFSALVAVKGQASTWRRSCCKVVLLIVLSFCLAGLCVLPHRHRTACMVSSFLLLLPVWHREYRRVSLPEYFSVAETERGRFVPPLWAQQAPLRHAVPILFLRAAPSKQVKEPQPQKSTIALSGFHECRSDFAFYNSQLLQIANLKLP